MDRGRIGGPSNDTVESIHFANEMSLAEATDGGIAAHRANGRGVEGDQRRVHTRSGRCTGCLDPCVTPTDDDDT